MTTKQLLDAARVIARTPHIREFLAGHDPKALEQLDRAIADAVLTPAQRRVMNRLDWLRSQVREQHAWIAQCGGNLSGYRAHYGDPDMSFCYGNGGTAIYKADTDELSRLEHQLDIALQFPQLI